MRRTIMAALAALALASLAGCDFSGGRSDRDEESRADDDGATRRFVNSEDNATTDSLREHYVDFSFEYPEEWEETEQPTDGSAQNFVQVSAPAIRGMEPIAFSVGSAYGSGDPDTDRQVFAGLVEQMSAQFSQSMGDYEMISSGEQRVGDYDSYGWRFEGNVESREGDMVRGFGRADIVMPENGSEGVFIIAIVSEDSDEADSAQEVGESGVLENVYDSFRFD